MLKNQKLETVPAPPRSSCAIEYTNTDSTSILKRYVAKMNSKFVINSTNLNEKKNSHCKTFLSREVISICFNNISLLLFLYSNAQNWKVAGNNSKLLICIRNCRPIYCLSLMSCITLYVVYWHSNFLNIELLLNSICGRQTTNRSEI